MREEMLFGALAVREARGWAGMTLREQLRMVAALMGCPVRYSFRGTESSASNREAMLAGMLFGCDREVMVQLEPLEGGWGRMRVPVSWLTDLAPLEPVSPANMEEKAEMEPERLHTLIIDAWRTPSVALKQQFLEEMARICGISLPPKIDNLPESPK